MGSINTGRVVLGGVAGGIVLNCVDYAVNGVWLAAAWTEASKKLNPSLNAMEGSAVFGYVAMDFIVAIVIAWLYASIRPRHGAGPRSAVFAALPIWFVLCAVNATLVTGGMFPADLMTRSLLGSLVGTLAAGYTAGLLYKEEG